MLLPVYGLGVIAEFREAEEELEGCLLRRRLVQALFRLICGAREFLIGNLLVRIHFIIVMIRWTGLAPWEFESPFPGSLQACLDAGEGPRVQALFRLIQNIRFRVKRLPPNPEPHPNPEPTII